MRKNRVFPFLMALALGLAAPACHKPAPVASKEYAKARELWLDLLREKRDKAFLAPEAEQVLDLLRTVDEKSLDGVSAQNLLKEITEGRAAARAEQAELEEKIEAAKRAGYADPSQVTFQNLRLDAGSAAGEGQDAGDTVPTPGMSEADFKSQFGGCFEFRNEATVGGMLGGEVWGLKDLLGCRQDFPGFIDNSVLLHEGKVALIRSNRELSPTKYKLQDGKLVPLAPGEEEPAKAPEAPKAAPAPAPAPENAELPRDPNDVTPRGGTNPNDVTPRPGTP